MGDCGRFSGKNIIIRSKVMNVFRFELHGWRKLCNFSGLCTNKNIFTVSRTVEKGVKGGEKSRARTPKRPVRIWCHKYLLLLYISSASFYDNLSALVHLQGPSKLMKIYILQSFMLIFVFIEIGSITAIQSLVLSVR